MQLGWQVIEPVVFDRQRNSSAAGIVDGPRHQPISPVAPDMEPVKISVAPIERCEWGCAHCNRSGARQHRRLPHPM